MFSIKKPLPGAVDVERIKKYLADASITALSDKTNLPSEAVNGKKRRRQVEDKEN
jgi:hypothetical protein